MVDNYLLVIGLHLSGSKRSRDRCRHKVMVEIRAARSGHRVIDDVWTDLSGKLWRDAGN